VRERVAKITPEAARMVRAGHPWVFHDSLLRPLEQGSPGQPVPVADPDGAPLGVGVLEEGGAIALRMIGRDPHTPWDRDEVERRVAAALARRDRLALVGEGEALRWIHGEADGLPAFAADRYGEYLVAYRYGAAIDGVLDDVLAALEAAGRAAGIRGVYLQDRARPVTADERRPPAVLRAGRAAPPDVEAREDGLTFLIDVTAPVSPGLFLDLREGRRWAERLAAGRRVLNLFSFTGAFGVRAARAGAREVVNVDALARSHARCRQNLAASGLDPEACEALTGDVFKHLERLRRSDRRFDLVIVDPPPFSNVKGAVFSALRDWTDLVAAIAPVLAEGGELLAVSNAVRLGEEEWMLAVAEGVAAAGRSARLVGEAGLPPDFPVIPAFGEGRYLKVRLFEIG
jgi:23S rRNA (cytosine1962-C5)-methyltransferase